ncbi:MAG: hypothetical protein LUD52_01720 [Opitutae bacterium]|nr:hypothetical protein [Opitutae bacterium]
MAFFALIAAALFAGEGAASPEDKGGSASVAEKSSSTDAVLAVKGEPGTLIFRVVDEDKRVLLGEIDSTGIALVDSGVSSGVHDFVFVHANADGECVIGGVELAAGKVVRLIPELKMRVGELEVSCQPPDVEIFIDGERRGRGVVLIGNMPVGKEVLVEARSPTLGVQSKTVKIAANSTERVAFDMRQNKPAAAPDARILLPDTQLALASQNGAVVTVDGKPAALKDGAIEGLAVGMHVVEISLPLGEKIVPVWKGAFAAHSAVMPEAAKASPAIRILDDVAGNSGAEAENAAAASDGGDDAAAGEEAPEIERKVPEAGTRIKIVVDIVLDTSRFKFSVADPGVALPGDGLCKIYVEGAELPVPAKVTSATSAGAVLSFLLPDTQVSVKESQTFEIEFTP